MTCFRGLSCHRRKRGLGSVDDCLPISVRCHTYSPLSRLLLPLLCLKPGPAKAKAENDRDEGAGRLLRVEKKLVAIRKTHGRLKDECDARVAALEAEVQDVSNRTRAAFAFWLARRMEGYRLI